MADDQDRTEEGTEGGGARARRVLTDIAPHAWEHPADKAALQALGERSPFGALILCPVRELAVQVAHELRNLARFTKLKVLAVYGGQRMRIQAPKLEKGPDVIVGTPGRVMDFHRRGLLPYDKLRFAVLDEVDRMLDIGFRDDIRKILGMMKREHQTIFVSATISEEIEKLQAEIAERYDFQMTSHTHQVFGLCSRCQRAGTTPTTTSSRRPKAQVTPK